MEKEFLNAADSTVLFTAWNSGENITTPEIEWSFVVDPFLEDSVGTDKSPKEWTPRHEYGGNRFPIRLVVFLHAVSARVLEDESSIVFPRNKEVPCELCFSDYKTAHTLDESDPMWLHPEEVDTVKVVVYRFIRAQLSGSILINAFDKANTKNQTCRQFASIPAAAAVALADAIVTSLANVMDDKDGPHSTCTMHDITCALSGIATAEEIEALLDHFHDKLRDQKMTASECAGIRFVVISLPPFPPSFPSYPPLALVHGISIYSNMLTVYDHRLYTGPPYVKFNGVLRDPTSQHLHGNTYINSLFASASSLRKISGASAIPTGNKVYRGMTGGIPLTMP